MSRIDELPEYRSHKPRYTHDLSHKFGFTATVAHLLPVFHDFLNAGETVELGFDYNLRTQPLTQAAMVDIDCHVEYFFVPMFLLYEPFGSMYYDINDQYSSFIPVSSSGSLVQNGFPVWDWSNLRSSIASATGDTSFEAFSNQAIRLLEHLGFNVDNLPTTGGSLLTLGEPWNPNVFPYQLLAYHCIYEYYYRLDSRERFDQSLFNWDKFFNTTTPLTSSDVSVGRLFQLHYRPKDSDYFTDVKVSPIVDVLNLNVKNSFDVAKSWLTRSVYNDGTDRSVLASGAYGSVNPNDGSDGGIPNNPASAITTKFGFSNISTALLPGNLVSPNGFDINTANIRSMFATEKLWSITGRARKHYDDQTLAHFGYQIPHDVKHEISCFGHDRSKVHIGEVISTADTYQVSAGVTTGTRIGDIAGKGYGSLNSKMHKFTAPCHGVVMAILSIVPDITYSRTFLKCNSVANREDLYTEEYDHLGMQPLFGYEGAPSSPSALRNQIRGWQYRYEQFKRRFNRVSHAFVGNGPLEAWMIDFRPPYTNNAPNSNTFGYYLHNPSELDQIMVVNYVTQAPSEDSQTKDVDVSTIYNGDPFVIDGCINCKKISTMSDYSLPKLEA